MLHRHSWARPEVGWPFYRIFTETQKQSPKTVENPYSDHRRRATPIELTREIRPNVRTTVTSNPSVAPSRPGRDHHVADPRHDPRHDLRHDPRVSSAPCRATRATSLVAVVGHRRRGAASRDRVGYDDVLEAKNSVIARVTRLARSAIAPPGNAKLSNAILSTSSVSQ